MALHAGRVSVALDQRPLRVNCASVGRLDEGGLEMTDPQFNLRNLFIGLMALAAIGAVFAWIG